MESNVNIVGDDSISGIQYLVNTLENNKPHIKCATAVMTVTPQYKNRIRFLAINGSYEYSSMQIDLPANYRGRRIKEKDVEKYVNTLLEQGGDLISAKVWIRSWPSTYTLLGYHGKWSTTTVKDLPDYANPGCGTNVDAKTDLLRDINGLTLKCADISIEVETSSKFSYRVHLPVNYTEEEYEVFLQCLSHIYIHSDRDEISGYLWYEDGSWSTRVDTGEYGSYYSWVRFTYPQVPIYLHKESSTPIPVELDVMDAHWDGTVDTDSSK